MISSKPCVLGNRIAVAVLIFITGFQAIGQSPTQQGRTTRNNILTAKQREARILLGHAKAAALNIKNDFQRGLVLDEIGVAEVAAGDLDAAVKTAIWASPHTMSTLAAIGEQLGNLNDIGRAQFLSSKLKSGESSTVLAFMSRRLAERGKIQEALQTTRKIQAPEVRSDALQWIAELQGVNGDYADARKTLKLAKSNRNETPTPDDIEMLIASIQLSRGDTEAARTTIASFKSSESRVIAMISGAQALSKRADKAIAAVWLDSALALLPPGSESDFLRYLALPVQVELRQQERALLAAGALSHDLRVKGYNAVAVVCAESKDVTCVNAALEKMQLAASSEGEDHGVSEFGMRLMVLNVTAALIDNGEFAPAERLLQTVEQNSDEGSSNIHLQPTVQLQRVVILAQQDRFNEARSLALKIRADSVDEVKRGTALRTIALLETKKLGTTATQQWASSLADSEDRAYALLGTAQALLGIGTVRLPYSVIQIH